MFGIMNQSKFLFVDFTCLLRISFRNISQVKTKYEFNLNASTELQFDNGLKHRKHPGIRQNPCLKLPYKLNVAVNSILNKYRSKMFRTNISEIRKEFFEVFIDTGENDKLRNKRTINVDENVDYSYYSKFKDEISVSENQKKYYLTEPYNSKQCAAYLAARLPAHYATLSYIFNEIKYEEPEFNPSTIFDFGSGIGTTTWAADEFWKGSISEYFCVDLNENMNELSRELLQNGTTYNEKILDRIFYRQFLPVKHKPSYDMVVSAFSLLEMPDTRSRIYAIENLWQKTSGMIVFVEHGSKAGFAAVMEARNFILQISRNQLDPLFPKDHSSDSVSNKLSLPEASVVAPCPHDLICPRQLIQHHKSFCNFKVNYNEIDYGQMNPSAKSEKFAYVVIKKNNSEKWKEDQKYWPRMVEPVLKKSNHLICRACTSDGLLKEVILTKRKSQPHLYKCAKRCNWGDKLPAQTLLKSSKIIDSDVEE